MQKKIRGLIHHDNTALIKELEVSIIAKCHLQCDNCGFHTPKQPKPSESEDTVFEISQGLSQLGRLNISIGSLAILGGEPSYNKEKLIYAAKEFSKFKNIQKIELVTHGLTPQNIDAQILKYINRLSISIYFNSKTLIQLWEEYVSQIAPHIELIFRNDKEWDMWHSDTIVSDEKAQEMFDNCFYRKHCVTIERNRLFICSRIPKMSNDSEGLILGGSTTFLDIEEYLNQKTFTTSCKSCTPMMGGLTVKAGVQPDDRISLMLPKAIHFLTETTNGRI